MISEAQIGLFLDMLGIESTTGNEGAMGEWVATNFRTSKNNTELIKVEENIYNVRCVWGRPRVWLCSHLDTVPPYISPSIEEELIKGRGSCDAKGQLFSMFLACQQMEKEGYTDFGLLALSGEETGSFGAKHYDKFFEGSEAILVGEPTDNCMVTASKGTHLFSIVLKGRECHSGYPYLGVSAISRFVDFVEALELIDFGIDPVLGSTTWNIGKLKSDNPQNILSNRIEFRIYFRTTFVSAPHILSKIKTLLGPEDELTDLVGDAPMHYYVPEGFPTCTVAFGSDAPRLTKFDKVSLCGPGSILVAHTSEEYITLQDIEKARDNYVRYLKLFLATTEKKEYKE